MIPVNLETLLYFKNNNIKHINLLKILDNKIHKDSIRLFQKIIPQINKGFNNNILRKRYIGIIRKYFNSIFFIAKIFQQIKKNYIIEKIYLSGWDSYDFKDIKKNFIVSRIVYELFKSRFDVVLIDKLKNNFSHGTLSLVLPEKINYDYVYINNLGYNFKKIVIKNFFTKRFKILTPEDKNLGLLKKFFYKIFLVKFIEFRKTKLEKNISNSPTIKFKIKDKKIETLLNFRNKHIVKELENLIFQNKEYLKLFKMKNLKNYS